MWPIAAADSVAGLGHDSKVGLFLYNGNVVPRGAVRRVQYVGRRERDYRYLDEELVPPRQRRRRGARASTRRSATGSRGDRRLPKPAVAHRGRRRRGRAGRRCPALTRRSSRARTDGARRAVRGTASTCSTPAARPACRRGDVRMGDDARVVPQPGIRQSVGGAFGSVGGSGLVRQIHDAGTRLISIPTRRRCTARARGSGVRRRPCGRRRR